MERIPKLVNQDLQTLLHEVLLGVQCPTQEPWLDWISCLFSCAASCQLSARAAFKGFSNISFAAACRSEILPQGFQRCLAEMVELESQ